FSATLRAETAKHAAQRADVQFGPGAWSQHVRLALPRLGPDAVGTVVVDGGLRGADGMPVPLGLVVTRAIAPDVSVEDPVALAPRADGTFVGEVAAGHRLAQVRAQSAFGNGLLVWKGAIDVAAGHETVVRVPWPPHGTVRLKLPGS